MKRILALALTGILVIGSMAGCGTKKGEEGSGAKSTTLKVAALESAYGANVWKEIVAAFEAQNEGVKVELTIDKNIEDIIGPKMKADDYPDVVHLAIGRPDALTETMIKDNAIRDLSTMLDMTVPGESIKVRDKIVPGFLDTLITNPYSDKKTYLAPMFYGPCGLFYNSTLLKDNGWEVPKTWDEMWELGEKAKAKGIALFTYPTTGYFDAFTYALMNVIGGPDFFNKAMTYSKGVWNTPEADKYFEIVGKLAKYTEKSTVANSNKENFVKNQQLVLDNKAIFIPNGTWLPGEMKDAGRAKGFEWGLTALPALKAGGDAYSYTFFEQCWSPKKAKNPALADKFMAFLYSDVAVDIFAKKGTSPAIQPIKNVSAKLDGENKLFYSIYDKGAKASMGAFATTNPVEGVSIAASLFDPVNSIVSGDKTIAEWQAGVVKASDALRAALK